jgi:hypothetical protein
MRPNLSERINLAAWYRYRIGVTNIDGAASAWADQSGNMRPLLQATASNRPTVLSDGSLLFDGVDNYMQATFTLAQPFTVYLAFQPITHTNNDVIFDGVTATTTLSQDTTTGTYDISAGTALAYTGTILAGTNGVIATVFDDTASIIQGANGAASTTVTGAANTNDAGGITLGAAQAPGSYSNIRVFEMAVYSVAHAAQTRLNVLRYMGRIAQVGGIT